MLSIFAGKKLYLYDPTTNIIHDLSNETEDCHINSLNKDFCSICKTEDQVKQIVLFRKPSLIKCPYCYNK